MKDVSTEHTAEEMQAEKAFAEWWNDVGESLFGEDEIVRNCHRLTFIDAFILGMGER